MRIIKSVSCVFLVLLLASPLSAQTGWTTDFLLRYQPPSEREAKAAMPPSQIIAQVFQTGTVPISLQDVIGMLLDHNLDVRSNRFSPRSSALQTLVFYRALQPALRFTGNFSSDTSASTNQTNGATVLTRRNQQFGVNFSQQLPFGTSLTVDGTMNRTSSNAFTSVYNPSYQGVIRYTVGQHLLQNRGKFVNTRQILVSQNNEKISQIQFETQITALIVQAQKSYWDLVFAAEDLKVKQRSLDVANQTLTENQQKVEIGTLAPIEVKQTQSEVANRRQQLIQSTGALVQNEDAIKKMISSETDPSLFLVKLATQDSPRNPAGIMIPALEEAVKVAMENRPELRQAQYNLKNSDMDVEYTKNQKKPILDVTGQFTQNGTGGTRTIRDSQFGGAIIDVIPGGVFSSFGQLFSYNYRGWATGFTFTIPLNNKAAIADYDRAVNERQLSQSKIDVTKGQIALEVRNALTQTEQARAVIETSRIASELARDQLDAEQTKFNLGTSTLRFVLEEQRNVAQAESTELQSIVAFNKALVDLDKSMGLTLMKNNVQIDKALQAPTVASKTLTDRARTGN